MVMMSAVNILSGEGGGIAGRCGDRVQQCWQFEHPRRDLILDTAGQSHSNRDLLARARPWLIDSRRTIDQFAQYPVIRQYILDPPRRSTPRSSRIFRMSSLLQYWSLDSSRKHAPSLARNVFLVPNILSIQTTNLSTWRI